MITFYISQFLSHYCVFPISCLQAQAVTLTVAQAFKVALDLWEIAQEGEFTEQEVVIFLLYVLRKKSFNQSNVIYSI